MTKKLVIGITGATGSIYAIRMLEKIKAIPDVESHLIISPSGLLNIKYELGIDRKRVDTLADCVHGFRDVGATLASGAFDTSGMVILPCSMRTLAACAHGFSDNLITRAADVHLKERRRLVLAVRETPFNLAHLRNMTAVTEMGGIIFPPLPAFYHHPKTLDEMIDHTVTRILGLFDIHIEDALKWGGM